ncbi:AVAST type 1 anti-phage system protease Avs1b [Bremerella sp. JC817]|uniref:AVAST type 1 anti-phage system protease Avs1b n=1 Tax=Bremerella sp. JC817 TaxID=3231756 RepID=UPI0034573E18
MFEIELRLSTCKVTCGDQLGTGFFVGQDLVITARHCVLDAIENKSPVALEFHVPGTGATTIVADVVDHEPEIDICLVRLKESLTLRGQRFDVELPREGTGWKSFGFPKSKPLIGHRSYGTIEAVLDSPKAKIDLDLSISEDVKLSSYSGLSGSPLIVGNSVSGILRVKMDNSLGAISTHAILPFLKRNGFKSSRRTPKDGMNQDLAQRLEFQDELESRVLKARGGFYFLEGAHGIGKSTFCQNLVPRNGELRVIGAYCVRESSVSNTNVRSQPSQLYDWITSAIATLITGRADRKLEANYEAMALNLETYLEKCSQFCIEEDKTGVIFIDGINEVADIEANRLSDFVGLLPNVLPANIAIIFSAPNFASLSRRMGGRVTNANVLKIPPLSDTACAEFASNHLAGRPDTSPALIDAIVAKAAGHPLYLNYLTKYVEDNLGESVLDDFPVLNGPIEDYYERIWQSIEDEANFPYLLGVIARLRDAIQVEEFVTTLSEIEQAAFLAVFAKWGHLFRTKSSTEMFHESFRTFVQSKTEILKTTINERLAKSCIDNNALSYCRINKVFHCLRASESLQEQCIEFCNQDWVDDCVLLSVEPEVLLRDVRDVVSCAARRGLATQVIRVLLLEQRVSFRYETLFAQSAGEVAKALVLLGRPQDALSHVFRYENLIVSPWVALEVAWPMIEREYYSEAVEVLEAVLNQCRRIFGEPDIEIPVFVEVAICNILAVMFLRVTGEDNSEYVHFVIDRSLKILEASLSDQDGQALRHFSSRIVSAPQVYFFAFKQVYTANDDLELLGDIDVVGNQDYINFQFDLLIEYLRASDEFDLPVASKCIEEILADIEEGCNHASIVQHPNLVGVIDALVRVNAPESIIARLLRDSKEEFDAGEFELRSENGVDANLAGVYAQYARWRVQAYLGEESEFISVVCIEGENWEERLTRASKQSALLDGAIRRAHLAGDHTKLSLLCEQVFRSVLPNFELSLAERRKWDRAYAIPEAVVPLVVTLLLECLLECSPESAAKYLEWIQSRSDKQCGLYTEGFRELLFDVCKASGKLSADSNVHASAFAIAQQLRQHILECVQNRYELVPLLLRLVKLFSSLGAPQVADECYRDVLRFSMGPSWYKEEQFDLLSNGLELLSESAIDSATICRIETLLELASGEMTFQRYVRDAKSSLVAVLTRKGKLSEAIRYFKLQVCGTTDELFTELSAPTVDRIDLLRGNRFPGGGIDEQQAVLNFVNKTRCSWRVRWAILEIFQIGDSRYFSKFGAAFARIINHELADDQLIDEMLNRLRVVVTSDLIEAAIPDFVEAFLGEIDRSVKQRFEAILPRVSPEASEFEKIVRSTEDDSESNLRADDEFYVPGFVGKSEGVVDLEGDIAKAQQQVTLGNIDRAREILVQALRRAQDTEWPIWSGSGSGIDKARQALCNTCEDPGELMSVFHDLIVGERLASSWFIANSLLKICSGLASQGDAGDLMEMVIDHVDQILGGGIKSSECIDDDAALGELSNDELFISLIAWCLTHPKWIRRDKSAEVLGWLFLESESYTQEIVTTLCGIGGMQKAFAFGLLNARSCASPQDTWRLFLACGNRKIGGFEPEDAYSISVQHQIASRASKSGQADASEMVDKYSASFRSGIIEVPSATFVLPSWAMCLRPTFDALKEIVSVDSKFVSDFEEHMKELCAPHDIKNFHQLEMLVAEGFSEPAQFAWDRWHVLASEALSRTLLGRVSLEEHSKVAQTLNMVNPSFPLGDRMLDIDSSFEKYLDHLKSGAFDSMVQDPDRFVLHYVEKGEIEDLESSVLPKPGMVKIEVIAFAISSAIRNRVFFLPEVKSVFPSSGLPADNGEDYETCSIPLPRYVYGGSFTPAAPLASFLAIAKASDEDCHREVWRCGRSGYLETYGRPKFEGCRTLISKSSIHLPPDRKLAWTISVNDKVLTMIDSQGNELF